MTDMITAPRINSTWTGHNGDTVTVTAIRTIHGRLNVAYNVGAAGAGIADLDHFLANHREVTQ